MDKDVFLSLGPVNFQDQSEGQYKKKTILHNIFLTILDAKSSPIDDRPAEKLSIRARLQLCTISRRYDYGMVSFVFPFPDGMINSLSQANKLYMKGLCEVF